MMGVKSAEPAETHLVACVGRQHDDGISAACAGAGVMRGTGGDKR